MSDIEFKNERIFKEGSKTFYNATKFFPEGVKKEITTLYAFVRIADEYVDIVPQQTLEFTLFRANLLKARNGEEVEDEIITAFVELEASREFDPAWADAFLDSMQMDLYKTQYKTYEEVLKYCYGSAAVIGLFICAIVGAPKESYPHAEALGNAFQLINFIRDIEEDDVRLNRSYIPTNDLVQFGFTQLDQKSAELHPAEFKQLMELQIVRYQELQQFGLKGIHFLPRNVQTAILTAAEMYDWTGKRILANPLIIFRKKIKPSKIRILITGLKYKLSLT
jgi:15-cis-phytoene synthase